MKDPKKPNWVTKKKDLVFVNDTSAFILHIIKERGLDPSTAMMRVGTDGGSGSFKVVCNVFDPDQIENQKRGQLHTGPSE